MYICIVLRHHITDKPEFAAKTLFSLFYPLIHSSTMFLFALRNSWFIFQRKRKPKQSKEEQETAAKKQQELLQATAKSFFGDQGGGACNTDVDRTG